MQRLLECPVCLNVYNATQRIPKTLMCGHGFCANCVQDLVQGSKVKCPKCRQLCDVPQNAISKLPTTFATLELLEASCEECRDQQWTQRCNHCPKNLCNKCTSCHMSDSSIDIQRKLSSLKTSMMKLKHESNEDVVLRQIQTQGENAISCINRDLQGAVEELQHNSKKMVYSVRDVMQSDTETFLRWRDTVNRAMLDMNNFVQQASSQASSANSDSSSNAILRQLTDNMAALQKLHDQKPKATKVTFHPCKESTDKLLPFCGTVDVTNTTHTTSTCQFSAPKYAECFYKTKWERSKHEVDFWPWSISISPVTNNLVVTDTMSNMLRIFEPQMLTLKDHLFLQGVDNGLWVNVAVSKQGEIYYVSSMDNCVSILDAPGNTIKEFGRGLLTNPRCMAFDAEGYLYVCDFESDQLKVFQSDGAFVRSQAYTNSTPGITVDPFSIAISRTGHIAVSDYEGNLHLSKRDGTFIRKIKAKEPPVGADITGVAFDRQDNIVAADQAGYLVVLSLDGQLISRMSGPGRNPGQLTDPRGVVVNADGDIVVGDMANGIQYFVVPKDN